MQLPLHSLCLRTLVHSLFVLLASARSWTRPLLSSSSHLSSSASLFLFSRLCSSCWWLRRRGLLISGERSVGLAFGGAFPTRLGTQAAKLTCSSIAFAVLIWNGDDGVAWTENDYARGCLHHAGGCRRPYRRPSTWCRVGCESRRSPARSASSGRTCR